MAAPEKLALFGGTPARATLLPYGRHEITPEDIDAVVRALRSDWITGGPAVAKFEAAFAAHAASRHAVSFSSGTAALHGAVYAAALRPGDEAITTPLTFCATANAILYQSAEPRFADIDDATLTLDPDAAAARASPRTRALIAVDFAGHPADWDQLRAVAARRGWITIADAAHATGAEYRGRRAGTLADLTTFSFHPVKHIAAGEGGMVTTDNDDFAARLRRFRNHGIASEARERQARGEWQAEMVDLGYNYRLSDIACALARSQLARLDDQLAARRRLRTAYDAAFAAWPELTLPAERPDCRSAWHIYPVRLRADRVRAPRDEILRALRAENIGATVHYTPVHLLPYYRERFGYARGLCPRAEAAAAASITLPLFPRMTDDDIADVVRALRKVLDYFGSN